VSSNSHQLPDLISDWLSPNVLSYDYYNLDQTTGCLIIEFRVVRNSQEVIDKLKELSHSIEVELDISADIPIISFNIQNSQPTTKQIGMQSATLTASIPFYEIDQICETLTILAI